MMSWLQYISRDSPYQNIKPTAGHNDCAVPSQAAVPRVRELSLGLIRPVRTLVAVEFQKTPLRRDHRGHAAMSSGTSEYITASLGAP